jgi:hypothetical protein
MGCAPLRRSSAAADDAGDCGGPRYLSTFRDWRQAYNATDRMRQVRVKGRGKPGRGRMRFLAGSPEG